MRALLMGAVSSVAAAAVAMTATAERPRIEMPRRLSVYPSSPFYNGEILRKVGVKIDGQIRDKDVVEFDADAGWIDIQIPGEGGRPLRNKDGTFKTKRLTGIVEPYWKGLQPVQSVVVAPTPAEHFQSAAEAKRARKAAKLAAAVEKGGITKATISSPVVEVVEKPKRPRAKKAAG